MPRRTITGPYIPRSDGEFRDWLNNFARVVRRDPSALKLTRADALRLSDLAERYEAAYVAATSYDSRTPTTVAAKNAVRRDAWDTVRPVSMRIKHNPAIPDVLKRKLGVYPAHTSQSPIPKPRSRPTLEVIEATPSQHKLKYSDPKYPSRDAKPPGVVQMHLLILIGDKPARTPDAPGRLRSITRHVFKIQFEPQDIGKVATYFGRWVTRRGLHGPWSRAVEMRIA